MIGKSLKFQEYISRLKNIYIRALCSFSSFEALRELKAHNLLGEKEVSRNIKIINDFKGLFQISEEAMHFHFLMELAKLFDNAGQSLHLNALINYAKSNRKHLSAHAFVDGNQGPKFPKNISIMYDGLNKKDFEEVERLLTDNSELIKKLNSYRDQNLAHEDKKKENITLTVEEIKLLFKIIEKILNLFSSKTTSSETFFDLLIEECKDDTKSVIDCLLRFEEHRLEKLLEK